MRDHRRRRAGWLRVARGERQRHRRDVGLASERRDVLEVRAPRPVVRSRSGTEEEGQPNDMGIEPGEDCVVIEGSGSGTTCAAASRPSRAWFASSKTDIVAKSSAGLLVYRLAGERPEVPLVHPGGPFFKKRDEGAGASRRGELAAGEEPLAAACRELTEETGSSATSRTSRSGVSLSAAASM